MEFFFVIFYKKIDKVSIKMLYFVNKIFLLEQLILGGKKIALINFAFLYDFTAFADISVFIKLVLVYKCGQKKLNNLYYQMKEQRR